MWNLNTICAFVGLIQAAAAQNLRYELVNSILVPKLKSDFAKNNVSAQWAPSYPKEWGSESFKYKFNEPVPNDIFAGAVTEDQKYLVMQNGTHIRFADLNTNSTVTTFHLGHPDTYILQGLTVRSAPAGGYDVLVNGVRHLYESPSGVLYRHVGADLKPTASKPTIYTGGLGAISKQGKMATTVGYIYDLDNNGTTVALEGMPPISDLSFRPDGVHLSTVSWTAQTADLWNASSGSRIFKFPDTRAQNWNTQFSPDGKYIAITVGNNNNTVLIYAFDNLNAKPIALTGFNEWPRSIQWSQKGDLFAVSDRGRVQVWKIPSLQLVQKWELEASGSGVYSAQNIRWVDDDKKILFSNRDATYVYDFGQNLKWWITPRVNDHMWNGQGVSFLKDKGVLVSADGDSVVRVWKL
ncbi:prolyl oligopeptidase [Periconia macrospinosa]|uniref:Prolyl oligopeptidase n=1 Tax=Periconia macrospinosa TaxID=97972 RepID=A0A2V1DS04_9PLEO|nr:prolyl oligopeptidase [Periconia macrospinosa]